LIRNLELKLDSIMVGYEAVINKKCNEKADLIDIERL
jgi:hypothetical protein